MNLILLLLLLFLHMYQSNSSSSSWLGLNEVTTVDYENEFKVFGDGISGLVYSSNDIMYAIMNDPSTLFKLRWNGTYWVSHTDDSWGNGKLISYKDGSGSPDSEDVTIDESGKVFVCSERDNSDKDNSKIVLL